MAIDKIKRSAAPVHSDPSAACQASGLPMVAPFGMHHTAREVPAQTACAHCSQGVQSYTLSHATTAAPARSTAAELTLRKRALHVAACTAASARLSTFPSVIVAAR